MKTPEVNGCCRHSLHRRPVYRRRKCGPASPHCRARRRWSGVGAGIMMVSLKEMEALRGQESARGHTAGVTGAALDLEFWALRVPSVTDILHSLALPGARHCLGNQ